MRDDRRVRGTSLAFASLVLTVKGPCEVASHGKDQVS